MTEREELPEWRKNVRQSFAEAAIAAIGDKRKDDGRQAFPQPLAIGPAGDVFPAYPGMTLRQYFAGQALVAMGQWSPLDSMVRSELIEALSDAGIADKIHRNRAAWAVAEADALIAALDAE